MVEPGIQIADLVQLEAIGVLRHCSNASLILLHQEAVLCGRLMICK
jgi:hypothetical protein